MRRGFDASEVFDLAAELQAAPARVIPALVPTANKAGVNIKRRMKADASGHAHLPGLARTVDYTVTQRPMSLEVEVGFRKEGQGNLANIAAFGTVNNAPVMDVTRGLVEETPAFVRWVAEAGARALL